MILVFAAMQQEARACLAALSGTREGTIAGFPVTESETALVCQTGLGRRAREAAEVLLAGLPPIAVLSVGTAGGLHPELKAGDIVLCERVDHAAGRGSAKETRPAKGDGELIRRALEIASGLGLPARVGTSVTVDSAAWGPADKSDLHGWQKHDIVEMESYWIGRAANERNLPFLAVRAVSDRAGDQLPEIPGILDELGNLDPERLLAFTREHPEVIPELARQHLHAQRAFESLTSLLAPLLPALAAPPAVGR